MASWISSVTYIADVWKRGGENRGYVDGVGGGGGGGYEVKEGCRGSPPSPT